MSSYMKVTAEHGLFLIGNLMVPAMLQEDIDSNEVSNFLKECLYEWARVNQGSAKELVMGFLDAARENENVQKAVLYLIDLLEDAGVIEEINPDSPEVHGATASFVYVRPGGEDTGD